LRTQPGYVAPGNCLDAALTPFALQFIETRRHWFDAAVAHDTGSTVNVLNLVSVDWSHERHSSDANSKLGRYPAPPLPVRRFGIAADPEKTGPRPGTGNLDSETAPKFAPDDQQREARAAWQKVRQPQPRDLDLEEARRRAREDWNDTYGHNGKS
jgi:hypothetical protein